MPQTPRLKPSRLPNRATSNHEKILEVLGSSTICTLSFYDGGQVYALPTAYVLHNNELVIHGSVKSNFLSRIIGQRVCITVFQLDGYVLAASAFHHSMNYASVVLFAKPREITSLAEKESSLHAFTEKIIPGRWDSLRPVKEGELHATRVLAFSLDQASCKSRTGGPSDEKEDENYPVWTGVLPLHTEYDPPQPSSNKKEMALPDHLMKLLNRI